MKNIKKNIVRSDPEKWGFDTRQLHVGQETVDDTGSRAVPIYQTTAYVFDSCEDAAKRFELSAPGYIYGRLNNPTQDVLEKRMASLEGGTAAIALASGASAVFYAIITLCGIGDNVVTSDRIYGGTYHLFAHTLPSMGINVTFVDPYEEGSFEKAINSNTKIIFTETLGNPHGDVADFAYLEKLAHKNNIVFMVDNTCASPYLIRPVELGADIVIESATKFLGGHSTTMGGIIAESGKFDWAATDKYPKMTDPDPSYNNVSFATTFGTAAFCTRVRCIILRDTGACISPLNAFLLLQGIETLSLRMERHNENAFKVVEFLKNHPKVEKVNHPSLETAPTNSLYKKYFPKGGASIFTFEIKCTESATSGYDEAQNFIDNLLLFSHVANISDMKSLVCHPASTTHSQLSDKELKDAKIAKNTIRLSIGTENIEDILEDLERGFSAIK